MGRSNDISEKARNDAAQEFLNFRGKKNSFIIGKYIEYSNKKTILLEKFNSKGKLDEIDIYNYEYSDYMEHVLSILMADNMLSELGYEKDRKGLWHEKKRGFFGR